MLKQAILLCFALLLSLICLASTINAFPMSMPQTPQIDLQAPDALVDMTEFGSQQDKFLRTFCRYCHSQPFFCGELLELCYARFRL